MTDLDLAAIRQPGLHAHVVGDPHTTAQELVGVLGAELVAASELREALERRAEADPHGDERRLLEHRARAGARDRLRILTDIDGLRALAKKLERAERIMSSTEANMTEVIGQRVSGGGLAVHPDSIRAAASDLLSVRGEVAALEGELERARAQVRELGPAAADVAADELPDDDEGLPGAVKRRIVGAVLASIGISIVLGGLLAVVGGVIAVIVLVIPILTIWWSMDLIREARAETASKEAVSQNLARTLARTEEVFGAGAGADVDSGGGALPTSPSGRVRLLEGRLELARERERSAAAGWGQLAGRDADPTHVDAILRERDPQFYTALEMVGETPQARAAASHRRRVQARWRVLWAALDREPPPPSKAVDAVRELEAGGTLTVSVATRRGEPADVELARACLDEIGREDDARPLIVLDTGDVVADDLVDQLEVLAGRTSVVVLTGDPAASDDGGSGDQLND